MSDINNENIMESYFLEGLDEGEKLNLEGDELQEFAQDYAFSKFENMQ
jgi:hypothetical protein